MRIHYLPVLGREETGNHGFGLPVCRQPQTGCIPPATQDRAWPDLEPTMGLCSVFSGDNIDRSRDWPFQYFSATSATELWAIIYTIIAIAWATWTPSSRDAMHSLSYGNIAFTAAVVDKRKMLEAYVSQSVWFLKQNPCWWNRRTILISEVRSLNSEAWSLKFELWRHTLKIVCSLLWF